jgi:hypothetical protein
LGKWGAAQRGILTFGAIHDPRGSIQRAPRLEEVMDNLEAVKETIEHLRVAVKSAYAYNDQAILDMWKRRDQGNGYRVFEKSEKEELEDRRINEEVLALQGQQEAYRQVLFMLDAEISRILKEHVIPEFAKP